jgi:hypothetical protein
MNESTPTPTPRTDEQVIRYSNGDLATFTGFCIVQADFARTLEIELAAAQDEAKRLREALDEIAEKCEHFLGCPVGPTTIADIARAALKAGEEGK